MTRWTMILRLAGLSLLTLTASCFTHASNGETALVFPLNGVQIKVDGELSDWPEHVANIPIQRDFFGNNMPAPEDFSASFKAAYSPQERALYIGIAIFDDSHVHLSDESDAWALQDSIILYLDPAHSLSGSGSSLFVMLGDKPVMNTIPSHWDTGSQAMNWDNAAAKMQRQGNQFTYEYRFDLGDHIAANRTIGFDLLITDKDEEDKTDGDRSLLIWGPFTGKSQSSARIGDLLLVEDTAAIGTLTGRVQLDDSAPKDYSLNRVRVTSKLHPELWIHTRVDETGVFNVSLPQGTYTVSSAYDAIGDPWRDLVIPNPAASLQAQVKGGETSKLNTLILSRLSRPDVLKEKGVLLDDSEGLDTQQVAELEDVIRQLMAYYKVPGASIALIKNKRLAYHQVFGVQNSFANQAVTPDTLFEAASITKAVFAFAVNRLAQRGVIDLDKPLFQYLPFDDMAYDPRYKKITARHALSHQTGFPNWAWMNDDGKLDLKFYPGIKYGYSGEGFEYLGRVIAHITGKDLEQVLREEVQDVMNFDDAFFSDSAAVNARVSHGHFAYLAAPKSTPANIGVAHSMQTQAKSFAQFMLGLMHKQGLSESGYFDMLEPQVEVPVDQEDGDWPWPQRFGLGFQLHNTPLGLAYGHGGNNGDFTCDFIIYEELDIGFAIFTNSNTGTAFHKTMHEYLVLGTAHAPKPK